MARPILGGLHRELLSDMVIHEQASPVRMRLSVSTGRVTWYVDAGFHRPAIEVACLLARQKIWPNCLLRAAPNARSARETPQFSAEYKAERF